MNMQDNEFDDLFRSKLDNFETEPSAQVWQNINAELDGKGGKKSIFPILSVAASIIILIAAGILFIPKKENVKPGHPAKNNLMANKVTPAIVKPVDHNRVSIPSTKNEQVAKAMPLANHIAKVHHPKLITLPAIKDTAIVQQIAKIEHAKSEGQPVLAVVPKKEEIAKPVASGIETPLAVKPADTNEIPGLQTKPVLASAQLPAIKPAVKKRGIHNMGDLVNLVVAKLDKRTDKIIEFTATDDDESTITAMNIGPIKIKKDK